jgi:hypothetical protein
VTLGLRAGAHSRPVSCYAQDPSYLGGSLGGQHALTTLDAVAQPAPGVRNIPL